MAGNAWKCLEMPGDDLKYLEMPGDDLKYLEIAGDDLKYLEIAGDSSSHFFTVFPFAVFENSKGFLQNIHVFIVLYHNNLYSYNLTFFSPAPPIPKDALRVLSHSLFLTLFHSFSLTYSHSPTLSH